MCKQVKYKMDYFKESKNYGSDKSVTGWTLEAFRMLNCYRKEMEAHLQDLSKGFNVGFYLSWDFKTLTLKQGNRVHSTQLEHRKFLPDAMRELFLIDNSEHPWLAIMDEC